MYVMNVSCARPQVEKDEFLKKIKAHYNIKDEM